jgi:phenylacetate-CoA ligase
LAAFAIILKDFGKDKLDLKLKAVISTSETLTKEDKALLSEVFGSPIGNEYGARDAGILAYSCPCGHLHMTAENAIIEVLDPVTHVPVAPGNSGVIAVTDLTSRAQPRLRWLLGDTATLTAVQPVCDCGITLPVIESLDGREDSMLVGENGRLIHGHMPNQIIRDYTQIRRFRFVQHTPETATLYLQADPDEELAAEIVRKFNDVVPSWRIETVFTDKIEDPPSGKKRASIREFSLQ